MDACLRVTRRQASWKSVRGPIALALIAQNQKTSDWLDPQAVPNVPTTMISGTLNARILLALLPKEEYFIMRLPRGGILDGSRGEGWLLGLGIGLGCFYITTWTSTYEH